MSRLGSILRFLLPDRHRASAAHRRLLIATTLFTLLALALNVAHTGLGLGGAGRDIELNAWLQNLVLAGATAMLALRAVSPGPYRASWIALLAGVACWTLGNTYWNLVLYSADDAPYPSPADLGWLLFYPCAYICIVLRVRASARSLPRSLWLDGVVGLLSVGAVGTALVVAPVLAHAEGSRAAVLTNAAYPMADLLLAGLCVAVFAWRGWRPGRGWIGLAFGFALFAAADSIYLLRLANDTYAPGSVLDSAWVIGLVAMSLAAWQPEPAAPQAVDLRRAGVLLLPFTFAALALAVLVVATVRPVADAAVALAAAAVLASMARTALSFGELGRLGEARRLAATDDLTGLPNRRHFNLRLVAALAQAAEDGQRVALLLVDLDRFKEVNDALGHHTGDLVLGQVGARLRSLLRAEDDLARLGGDEFAVLIVGDVDVDDLGRRIHAALDRRFNVAGFDVQIGGSIGIARFPEDAQEPDVLLQRADVAMYQAKATQAGHTRYDRRRDGHTRERLRLIAELRAAIGTDQLVLHYQPKLALGTGGLDEVEALVRWQHPTRGLLGPGEFISLAEQSGVMGRLTDHVLDRALAQSAAWRERGLDLIVAVNVSPATVLDDSWAENVGAGLERHAVPATRLRVEITEDALMLDTERSVAVVRALAATGVRVSLDDFGTGFSSLGLLKHLRVDEVKIDRGFVTNLLQDAADAAIVESTIELAHRLGIQVVAEGVEDAATLERLRAWGADAVQGFHVSRPVPAPELEAWLVTAAQGAVVAV